MRACVLLIYGPQLCRMICCPLVVSLLITCLTEVCQECPCGLQQCGVTVGLAPCEGGDADFCCALCRVYIEPLGSGGEGSPRSSQLTVPPILMPPPHRRPLHGGPLGLDLSRNMRLLPAPLGCLPLAGLCLLGARVRRLTLVLHSYLCRPFHGPSASGQPPQRPVSVRLSLTEASYHSSALALRWGGWVGFVSPPVLRVCQRWRV